MDRAGGQTQMRTRVRSRRLRPQGCTSHSQGREFPPASDLEHFRCCTRSLNDISPNKDGSIAMTDARLYSSARPAARNDHKDHIAATGDLDTLPRTVQTAAGTPLWNLTPQQWRVFLLVGKALSNKAIAHELRVAESTVKAHVSAIFKMAGCRNHTEAALLSQRVRYGLLDADDSAPLSFPGLGGSQAPRR